MKNTLNLVWILLSLLIAVNADSQIYNYTNDLNGIPNSVDPDATGTNLARVNGATTVGIPCPDGFNSRGFSNTAVYNPALAAIEFSMTPDAGYEMTVQSFSIGNRRNASGPANMRLAYSTDGGSIWITNGLNSIAPTGSCGVMTTFTWDMADFSSTTSVLFRAYGFNAASTLGQHQLKNVIVNGTVDLIPVYGCIDPSACNYDPAANTDDGSCAYGGCTNPVACNYNPLALCDDGSCTVIGGPCDDGDPTTHSDFVQGDCSCLGYPSNDEQAGAAEILQSEMGTCDFAIAVNLMYATTSAGAHSTAITGEDIWYSFVAQSTAARIEASSTTMNALVELQDGAGVMLDQENVTSTGNPEYLNKDNLTQGDTYYIVVRNYDSGIGTGWMDLCAQYVPDSRIDNLAASYSNTCAVAKADWTGAYSYQFVFTNHTTSAITNLTKTGTTYFTLKDIPGMEWDEVFDAEVNPTYHLYDAAGGMETIFVRTDEISVMNINPHPLMAIRAVDKCADGPNPLGSSIAGEPFVCMTVDYQWEFTRTDIPAAPIYKLRGAANRFIQLNTVGGLVMGATYDVRVRPVFAYGYGNWGAVNCMSIVGTSSLILDNEIPGSALENFEETLLQSVPVNELTLYPNPCNGERVTISLDRDMQNSKLNLGCYDSFGKLIASEIIDRAMGPEIEFVFPKQLAQGIYVISISDGSMRLYTQCLIVTH